VNDFRLPLEQMATSLAEAGHTQSSPPLEHWQPKPCGELPLEIDSQGQWWTITETSKSAYRRPALVKMLSQVLWCEPADYTPNSQRQPMYSLRTPHESVTIQVVDVPFTIVDYNWLTLPTAALECTTNLGEKLIIGPQHPLIIRQISPFLPYTLVRRNLWARFNRSSYYRLAHELLDNEQPFQITSQGHTYSLEPDSK